MQQRLVTEIGSEDFQQIQQFTIYDYCPETQFLSEILYVLFYFNQAGHGSYIVVLYYSVLNRTV